jgi:hypothetical protein
MIIMSINGKLKSNMKGKSKEALQKLAFIEKCRKATYKIKIITFLCLVSKVANC